MDRVVVDLAGCTGTEQAFGRSTDGNEATGIIEMGNEKKVEFGQKSRNSQRAREGTQGKQEEKNDGRWWGKREKDQDEVKIKQWFGRGWSVEWTLTYCYGRGPCRLPALLPIQPR